MSGISRLLLACNFHCISPKTLYELLFLFVFLSVCSIFSVRFNFSCGFCSVSLVFCAICWVWTLRATVVWPKMKNWKTILMLYWVLIRVMTVSSPVLCTTELFFLHCVVCVDKEQPPPPKSQLGILSTDVIAQVKRLKRMLTEEADVWEAERESISDQLLILGTSFPKWKAAWQMPGWSSHC